MTVGRHLLLARAAVASQQGRVALTGASAAALHGFAAYGSCLTTVHLIRLDGGSSRSAAECPAPRYPAVISRKTWRTTEGSWRSVRRGRYGRWRVRPQPGERRGAPQTRRFASSRALARGLDALADRFARFPGSGHGRTALRLADPRSESVGESVTRVKFFRFGIPIPELQHKVFDSAGTGRHRGLLLGADTDHLGEFDGKVKYLKYLRPGESPSDCVFREKRREDRMRAGSRGMSRFVWASSCIPPCGEP